MSAGRVHQVLATLGYGDAIGHEVHTDDPTDAAVEGAPHSQLTNGPEAEHRQGVASVDVRVLDRLPRRRQDVREVEEPFVRQVLRKLDGAEVGTVFWPKVERP